MLEVRQGFRTFSEPMKQMEVLTRTGRILHGNDPVTRWCIGNTVVAQDPAANIKPDKRASADKIDGVVSGLMALACRLHAERTVESVYESRGLRTL